LDAFCFPFGELLSGKKASAVGKLDAEELTQFIKLPGKTGTKMTFTEDRATQN